MKNKNNEPLTDNDFLRALRTKSDYTERKCNNDRLIGMTSVIHLDRKLDGRDCLSLGGFKFVFNGEPISFDFKSSYGTLNENNQIVTVKQIAVDTDAFPEANKINSGMLITGIEKFYIYCETKDVKIQLLDCCLLFEDSDKNTEKVCLSKAQIDEINSNILKQHSEEKTRMVAEMCSVCEKENSILWNTESKNYITYCPQCGSLLLLCGECQNDYACEKCDWADKNGCKKCKKISFNELVKLGYENKWKKAVICFSQNSFSKPYTERERSYVVSSSDRSFCRNSISSEINGDCLDGKDVNVRLDSRMWDNNPGWKPEYCYIVE